jgi:hypothetical protein
MTIKAKTFRRDQWDPKSETTVYVEELDDPSTQRTILIRVTADGMPIGRVVGEEGRKQTVGGPRNPWRTPKVRMLWKYALTGEHVDLYSRYDSQADALRQLIRTYENRQNGIARG